MRAHNVECSGNPSIPARQNRFSMAGLRLQPPTEIIVPARDSWSRMVPSPLGVRVPARQHRRPWPQRASLFFGTGFFGGATACRST